MPEPVVHLLVGSFGGSQRIRCGADASAVYWSTEPGAVTCPACRSAAPVSIPGASTGQPGNSADNGGQQPETVDAEFSASPDASTSRGALRESRGLGNLELAFDELRRAVPPEHRATIAALCRTWARSFTEDTFEPLVRACPTCAGPANACDCEPIDFGAADETGRGTSSAPSAASDSTDPHWAPYGRDACWHCGVVLIPERPICEDCVEDDRR